jgi:anthranilate phosphoribosyltransferase
MACLNGAAGRVKALTEKLRAGRDLNHNDVRYAVTVLLSDDAPAGDKADFLRALHNKGETADEIAGFVEQLIGRAIDPQLDPAETAGSRCSMSAAPAATARAVQCLRRPSCSSSQPVVRSW